VLDIKISLLSDNERQILQYCMYGIAIVNDKTI